MAYCRFGEDSDVYLYGSVAGGWICCSCRLQDELLEGVGFYQSNFFLSLEEVQAHLEAHREAGHLVPDYAFERVEKELGWRDD